MTSWFLPRHGLLVLLCSAVLAAAALAANDECLSCHEDPGLKAEDGRSVGVHPRFAESVHAGLECRDCHSQAGDYEDIPHFARYQPVDCAACHEDAVASHRENFHFKARQDGNTKAPDCIACHATGRDPHRLHALGNAVVEESCRQCHKTETAAYDSGVHAARPGARSDRPGCVTCHQSHGPGLPPSAGAVNGLCESCHKGAMADVQRGGHVNLGQQGNGALNCASCHDVHGTHKPRMSDRVVEACTSCHAAEKAAFTGSVHADLLDGGGMNCLSCHSTHKDEEAVGRFDGGCGSCHSDVEETYRSSVHRFGRLHGNEGAATCADCHGGHHVLAANDPAAPINPVNIPQMCGHCHGGESVITNNFVRLPITLSQYEQSVHGKADKTKIHAATCTDCHGVHDLKHAQDPESSINHFNLVDTCGKCHEGEAGEYRDSIHGHAVAIGLNDAPTCNTCHDEHLIRSPLDPEATTSPQHVARELCGDCHTDPEMNAKYGLTAGVVESFLDSYHGWAIDHGGTLVATCIDCHTTHSIRSPLDPASSISPANVVNTCRQCHARSNEAFALSYTHASALAARAPHDWAKLIYVGLITFVLGGMVLHNLIVARYEIIRHRQHRKGEDYVIRWNRVERVQHLVLMLSFIGLAITGFALRAPDSWWVQLIGLGGREAVRAYVHRGLAIILTVASFYHIAWLAATRRGRTSLAAIVPKLRDLREFPQNMAFHLGMRAERPRHHRYDYTRRRNTGP
ncbi:MAG: cytochrome c3 family protein [Candidatus Krumholzibacteriia bacterium]